MRRVSIAEFLVHANPNDVVDALTQVVDRAREPDFTVVVDALGGALARDDLVDYDTRRAIYDAAKQRGIDDIARLLFSASRPSLAGMLAPLATSDPAPSAPHKFSSQQAADTTDVSAAGAARPLTPRGRPLTLGERKSLARSHDREALLALLRDPHPAVIDILLGNPHLTEHDVLTIASRRPSLPESLELVAASDRWIARYRIKRALALNPYTPLPCATRLVTALREGDLRDIAGDAQLHAGLREHARALLSRRRRRPSSS